MPFSQAGEFTYSEILPGIYLLRITGKLRARTLEMVTQTTQMPPSRNGVADLMKGTACLLMIQVHVLELFIQPDFVKSPAGQVGMFLGGPSAAPVFMAVMGWFLAQTTKTARQLAFHGLRLLGLGFALNLGLNAHLLIRMSRGAFDFLNPWHYVFGVDILFLAGLSMLILSVWRAVTGKMPEGMGALIALTVVAGATSWVNRWCDGTAGSVQYVAAFIGGTATWSYFPVFPWFGYVLMGMAAHGVQDVFHERPGRGPIPTLCLAAAGGLATVTGGKAFAIANSLPEYYHHGALFLIWVGVFLGGWWALHFMTERNAGQFLVVRYLKWAGRNITAMYVFQWLIIGNLATAVYQTVLPGAWLPCWGAVTIASTAFTVTWLKLTGKRAG